MTSSNYFQQQDEQDLQKRMEEKSDGYEVDQMKCSCFGPWMCPIHREGIPKDKKCHMCECTPCACPIIYGDQGGDGYDLASYTKSKQDMWYQTMYCTYVNFETDAETNLRKEKELKTGKKTPQPYVSKQEVYNGYYQMMKKKYW